MDKEHKQHHSAHEHKAEHTSSGEKILGFGVNTIVLLAILVIATAIIATIVGYDMGQSTVKPVITGFTVD